MNRRHFLLSSSSLGSALALGSASVLAADAKHQHHAAASAVSPRYTAIARAYSACAAASSECIAHCQAVLATGDKSMGLCLKTALDCDAICEAVAKLARFDSDFTPALARQSVAVMQACADACKPHVEHHATCKACFEACNETIRVSQAV